MRKISSGLGNLLLALSYLNLVYAKNGYFDSIPYVFSCHRGGELNQKNDIRGDSFCETTKDIRNCPFIPRRYWCGEEYTASIMSKIEREYPKSKLFLDSYQKEWIEILEKNRGILFIGDSVHSHTAFSLMCSLRNHATSKKYPIAELFPYSKKIGKFFERATRKYFCIKTFRKSTVCYDRTNTANNVLAKYTLYKKLFSEFGLVVMNFGLHNQGLDMDPIRELLSRLSKDLAQSKTKLIWRETAPQHFNNYGGVFSPDKLKQGCADISFHSTNQSNQFNLKYNPICEENNIPILKIWNMTKGYFDAHVQGECTHYCQPGVSDLWLEELLILIKSIS